MVLDEENGTTGVKPRIYRMDLESGDVSEIIPPDFLPEAEAAFEKSANE
jgi:hypothetical protein